MTTPGEPPTYRTGKICYIEIPAKDVQQSAVFYQRAFGWQIRQRGDGSTAFDDTVNEVSGTWVLGRPVATAPGLMVYIMVGSAAAAVQAIVSAGGAIVTWAAERARATVAATATPDASTAGSAHPERTWSPSARTPMTPATMTSMTQSAAVTLPTSPRSSACAYASIPMRP